MKNTISVEELRKAVKLLKKYEQKPVWRLTWEFPFLKRFYVFHYGRKSRAGKSIDNIVKEALEKNQ